MSRQFSRLWLCRFVYSGMGHKWSLLWVLGELANGCEYGNDYCYFLMVFIIQSSQNRDGLALQIKLDEIIRAVGTAHNEFIDLEDRPHDELDEIKSKFSKVAVKARNGKGGRSKQ